jgi:hypothetical protein
MQTMFFFSNTHYRKITVTTQLQVGVLSRTHKDDFPIVSYISLAYIPLLIEKKNSSPIRSERFLCVYPSISIFDSTGQFS